MMVYLSISQFIVFKTKPSWSIIYWYVYWFLQALFKLEALGYFISWYLVEIIRHETAINYNSVSFIFTSDEQNKSIINTQWWIVLEEMPKLSPTPLIQSTNCFLLYKEYEKLIWYYIHIDFLRIKHADDFLGFLFHVIYNDIHW